MHDSPVKKSVFSKLSLCLRPRTCSRIPIHSPPPPLSLSIYLSLFLLLSLPSLSFRLSPSLSFRLCTAGVLCASFLLFLSTFPRFSFFCVQFLYRFLILFPISVIFHLFALSESHVDRTWHYNSKESSKQ